MKNFLLKFAICLVLLGGPSISLAFLGDGGAGWAQIPYLVKILAENIKRYQQLRMMINTAKHSHDYIKLINEGLENSIGLIDSLPIKDERILSEIRNFKDSYESIANVYGSIPKSPEAAVQLLHDKTVAESIKMVSDIKTYAKQQEENAITFSMQGRQASPKGAARMNTEVNAKILHTLNQLLKLNGQILKLQSEQLAMANKNGKESVGNFIRINKNMKHALGSFAGSFALPRF